MWYGLFRFRKLFVWYILVFLFGFVFCYFGSLYGQWLSKNGPVLLCNFPWFLHFMVCLPFREVGSVFIFILSLKSVWKEFLCEVALPIFDINCIALDVRMAKNGSNNDRNEGLWSRLFYRNWLLYFSSHIMCEYCHHCLKSSCCFQSRFNNSSRFFWIWQVDIDFINCSFSKSVVKYFYSFILALILSKSILTSNTTLHFWFIVDFIVLQFFPEWYSENNQANLYRYRLCSCFLTYSKIESVGF